MPGVPTRPIGVFDHPPDEDVPGLRGVRIGDTAVGRLAVDGMRGLDAMVDFIDSLNPL